MITTPHIARALLEELEVMGALDVEAGDAITALPSMSPPQSGQGEAGTVGVTILNHPITLPGGGIEQAAAITAGAGSVLALLLDTWRDVIHGTILESLGVWARDWQRGAGSDHVVLISKKDARAELGGRRLHAVCLPHQRRAQRRHVSLPRLPAGLLVRV